MEPSSPVKLFTEEQVADNLQIHVQTVRGFMKRGELDYVLVGKRRRIAPDQLAKFIDDHRTGGDPFGLDDDDDIDDSDEDLDLDERRSDELDQ
jgi:excisionase family DNA binding protein